MAEYQRPTRPVVLNNPDLNQAMIPFVPHPPNPYEQRANNQVVAVANNSRKHNQSGVSTRVLAVVQRPCDQIVLTEDDKGKQMVVQRAHNVAKIQRRQRNEDFKPSDLRLRGKQRPVTVGVVGRVDATDPDHALWRARQLMQNIQSQRSDQHRPLQEEKEFRLAEEARLRALAKNEKKMKSYRVDMGHLLENNAPAIHPSEGVNEAALHNAFSDMRVSNSPNAELGPDQINKYEVLDEYMDDEIYNHETENSRGAANNISSNEENTCDEEVINCGDEDKTFDNERTNHNEDFATKFKKYYENCTSSNESTSSDENDRDEQENNGFLGDEQSLVEYKEEEAVRQESSLLSHVQTSRGALRRAEAEERNRLRMLEIRQRQQTNMIQVIEDTAPARQQEAARKAEQARQKALKQNEKKMKSYRVTTGFTLGSAASPGTDVQQTDSSSITRSTTRVQSANSSSTGRSSITKSTSGTRFESANSSTAEQSNTTPSTTRLQSANSSSTEQSSFTKSASHSKAGSPAQVKLTKEEREKRRQEENRQKMLAARQKQQEEYARRLEQTAETRRLEEERKAEQARLKALEKNERKMKSYKVTLGYSLEDYLKDSAPCTDNTLRAQGSSTMRAQHCGGKVVSALCTDNSFVEQGLSTIHAPHCEGSVVSAPCTNNTLVEQGSSTMHAQHCEGRVVSASRTDNTLGEKGSSIMHAQHCVGSVYATPCNDTGSEQETLNLRCISPESKPSVDDSEQVMCNNNQNEVSMRDILLCSEARRKIENGRVINEQVKNRASDVQCEEEEEVEEEGELTEEQRNELFREKMRAARQKKQAELDKIIAERKHL